MEKSQSITSLAKALMVFHVKVGKIRKDATNPFFGKKYPTLTSVLDTIEEPLREAGLVFSQLPSGDSGLITILIHAETGEFIQSEYTMKAEKEDPQKRGSAITYQRRYALAAVLGLGVEEDDDANGAAGKNGNAATIPANKTTAYNHKPLGSDTKPLITNGQYKKLLDRVKGGDMAAGIEAMKVFSFEDKQLQLLKSNLTQAV